MKQRTYISFLVLLTGILWTMPARAESLRPPSVPLVACDPYFSIWSPADHLTDTGTTHWTGKPQHLTSIIRIDGKSFRVMGDEPGEVPALEQKNLEVLPTRTIYSFEGSGVDLTLTFMTAALPEDLDLLSRPVTYLTWDVESTDGKEHDVQVYFGASGELTVNVPTQEAVGAIESAGPLRALRIGSTEQPVLQKKGDDIRIDWGYLYVAAPEADSALGTITKGNAFRDQFVANGFPTNAVYAETQPARADAFTAAFTFRLGEVGKRPVSRFLILAYDDLYSIQYMKHNLRPYWRRNGWQAKDLLKAAAHDYHSLTKRCEAFDKELMADLERDGGEHYAQIAALAYRQCFAAGKIVADDNGEPLQFCKENHSNGCIGTSDVFYPMSPQFLLFGPSLAKAFIVPFMNYAASDHWKFPFAPHDLGTYPKANGQVYGGGERTEENQMPVEETGNLLILMGAVAEMEGNADFAGHYWPQLEKWAEYLKAKGFDPENQLCTDDFAGHLAHNVNLSAKAICGLASFGKLCEMRGDQAQAEEYASVAREFAKKWVAAADSGDHYRLAFDKPDTWSQKYNATWDRILGLNLWPASTWRKEMDFYKKVQNEYGLPLDNRKDYTKLDWTLWTATLTENADDFHALVDPVFRFLNATPDRTPMTDWYQTKTARRVGFDARPVVGGVYLRMLYDKPVWKKWAGRDRTKASDWAPMPEPPQMTEIVPAADEDPATWHYTTRAPGNDWFKPGFDDSGWKIGKSGFGTQGTPGAVIGTYWNTSDIWLRREVRIPSVDRRNLKAWMHHDEDAELYINGVLAVKVSGWTSQYDAFPIRPAALAAIKPGENLISIHCHQTTGGQFIDAGFQSVQPLQNAQARN